MRSIQERESREGRGPDRRALFDANCIKADRCDVRCRYRPAYAARYRERGHVGRSAGDASHRRDNYDATERWRFVDPVITDPDVTGLLRRKPVPAAKPASVGDKMACMYVCGHDEMRH